MAGLTPEQARDLLRVEPGDRVKIPWIDATFTVVAVDGDEAWVKDLRDNRNLTVGLDCLERTP